MQLTLHTPAIATPFLLSMEIPTRQAYISGPTLRGTGPALFDPPFFPKMAATGDEAIQTTAEKAPVTLQRKVDTFDLNIPKPHIPRALVAPDNDHPHGSVGHKHNKLTVLQQHVEFFDRNNDGIIYPWETYAGFRAIGFNPIISILAMLFINISFSYSTFESWIPSPLFPIYIKNIHRTKHGSDTEVYDTEGRFVPSKFEEMFSKYARTRRDRLTFRELLDMTEANRNAYDFFGWVASKLEWGVTYWLVKDEKCFAPKDAIRGVYDGSLFHSLEKREKARKASKFV